jgi:site-specific DNA recombinase
VSAPESKRRRCAIYTRKSSEEGLEQDFNSLDAQREASEAYIRSQKSEGWILVPTRYDDGGFSGGTIERPALTRLLADIDAGKIDTVVVYKVDRLTRSLSDFAKIVDVLDGHSVSFVSITQQFNTTTSMGRLTLNMLLSFAQFEREVTGERIRDKIAASKRKGLWMGGPVPLGYAPNGRTLTIVEAEAKTVRTVFRLYLELGSVRRLKEEVDRLGLTSKHREAALGKMRGGRPLGRGYLYHLLGNPLYIGRVPHKADSYEGQHPAIIDPETWDAVQKQLATQGPVRSTGTNGRSLSPLQGKLFDESGVPLTPSHTVKSGRRYRYYVSRHAITGGGAAAGDDSTSRWRLPAREIERLVGEGIVELFRNRGELTRLAREARVGEGQISGMLERVERWDWKPLEVVKRIDLGADEVILHVDLTKFTGGEGPVVRQLIQVHMQRRGVERRLVIHGSEKNSRDARGDPALVKAIARGRKWFEALASGRVGSLLEIAEAEGLSDRYVGQLIPLAFLAPHIIVRVLSGTQPLNLTTETLAKRINLPFVWIEQMSLLDCD